MDFLNFFNVKVQGGTRVLNQTDLNVTTEKLQECQSACLDTGAQRKEIEEHQAK